MDRIDRSDHEEGTVGMVRDTVEMVRDTVAEDHSILDTQLSIMSFVCNTNVSISG